jgi:NitT/TauT family transport system permease protein
MSGATMGRSSSGRGFAAWRPWLLGLLPIAALLALYAIASHLRLSDNPDDKLLPGLGRMVEAMRPLLFEADGRSGRYLFLSDTVASLTRLLSGVGLAALAALLVGINMGLHRRVREVFGPTLTVIALIPPLAVLPILFIALGVDEASKITLIFIGVFPLMARDLMLATEALPREGLVKAVTLGATPFGITYRLVLPQMLPRLLDSVRLALGGAWLFLIAAEAIASTEGLGYRIFLVRRYLSMDVILPYVAWITLLGFLMDWLVRRWVQAQFPWYAAGKRT